jgi:outer membrane protein TolC
LAAVQARYDFAQANYQKTVREAMRNVEDSLVRLNVANDRARSAQQAQQNYQQLLQATESRYDAGLSNRIALEEARRSSLQAQDAAATMAREQVSAWIALYKALGGGWERATQRDTSAENNTKS